MKLENKNDIKYLIENNAIEIKKADDTFPKDALETYSAFANTNGGHIIFGIDELKDNRFNLVGVSNKQKIIKEMFDSLNNKKQVSKNLITDNDIVYKTIDNKEIIIISVPSAKYTDKPIFLKNNRYNCYYRLNSSDYKCTEDMVNAMIRDASPTSFDSTIVDGFTINDLDENTIRKYRTYFNNLKPNHPYNNENNRDFLVKIGAMLPNRKKQNEFSPSIAGLLIFGKTSSILERLPHLHLEYIDKIDVGIKYDRWRDRVIHDGTWGEGNLYNFFFTVINKLNLTLKSNFELSDDNISRKENTPMKIAIRESFVNSIIHNDFQNIRGIIIKRENDRFVFENGGSLRISKNQFFIGGYSEPRNYNIFKIFSMINLCERAGSGIPKVVDAVNKYNLIFPKLSTNPDNIVFELFDVSKLDTANDLTNIEKKILSLIIENKYITRKDIENNFELNKTESLKILNNLSEKRYIEKTGKSVATKYKVYDENYFSKDIELYNLLESVQDVIKNKINK